jgi:plastocyanin
MKHILAIVIVTVAVAACGSSSAPSTPAATPPAPAGNGPAEVTGSVPAGSIVSLRPASGESPMPSGPAVMDQYAKQFVPNELYVRVGQPVEFRNTEDQAHNVTVNRRGTGAEIFNVETDPAEKHVHTFDRVGQYDVSCNVHPGMQATVIATTGALATTSGVNGMFSIPNVPAGKYTVSVTFEGRTVEQAVDVTSPRTEVRIAR